MKKIFTLIALTMLAMTAMATDYTDSLRVSVAGTQSPTMQNVKITIDNNADGTYNFTLKDFSFGVMDVGTVKLTNLTGTTLDGVTTIDVKQKTRISGMGIGLLLGEIEITLKAKFTSEKLYATITIPVTGIGNVDCVYGAESTVTRIGSVPAVSTAKTDVIYDLNGRRVSRMKPGQVYVVRHADGTSAKIVGR